MYSEVGKKIKVLAKVIVIIMTIPSVLLGIGIFVWLAQFEELAAVGFFIGIGVIALGYFFAWLSRILLYAYGELVDKTVSIESYLAGRKPVMEKPVKTVPVKEKDVNLVVPRNPDGSWDCPFRNTRNAPDAVCCKQCHIMVTRE